MSLSYTSEAFGYRDISPQEELVSSLQGTSATTVDTSPVDVASPSPEPDLATRLAEAAVDLPVSPTMTESSGTDDFEIIESSDVADVGEVAVDQQAPMGVLGTSGAYLKSWLGQGES